MEKICFGRSALEILIVFSCLLCISTVNPCPDECQCDLEGTVIGCKNLNKLSVTDKMEFLNNECSVSVREPYITYICKALNRSIPKLGPKTFTSFLIRYLVLSYNGLHHVDENAFFGMVFLDNLDLSNNDIGNIPEKLFYDTISLAHLNVSNNKISTVHEKAFYQTTKLKLVDLSHNRIKTISEKTFHKCTMIRHIYLQKNQIECDCRMSWVEQYMRFATENNDVIYGFCSSPRQHYNKLIRTLREPRCHLPFIKVHPKQAANYSAGMTHSLRCYAIGLPTPRVEWYHNNKPIVKQYNLYVDDDNSLNIVDLTTENNGEYFCKATNVAGTFPSRVVNIQVTTQPIIRYPVLNATVKTGQNVKFDCIAKGSPIPHVAWHKDGNKLLLSERVKVYHNGTLKIMNTNKDDVGSYLCIATNIYGKARSTATLSIFSIPIFTVVPRNKSVILGVRVELKCDAKGTPEPTISWYKNMQPLQQEDNIIFNTTKELIIIEMSESDSGEYSCRAQNRMGMIHTEATLRIKDVNMSPPKVIVALTDTEAYRETTVQLPCEVESELPVIAEWRKDGTRVKTDDRLTVTLIGSLVIKNVSILDTGRYECSVHNDFGRHTVSAFLTIKDHRIPGDEFVKIAFSQAEKDIDQAVERTMQELFQHKEISSVTSLFRVINYPNAGARGIARAAEVYERTLNTLRKLIKSGLNVTTAENFDYFSVLKPEQLDLIARLSGCTAHRNDTNCSNIEYHKNYRSIDGSCNNLKQHMWGSSLTPFRRILLPVYENGFSQPVGWDKERKYNGFLLPSARLISTKIIKTDDISQDTKLTHMVMQWGQWLDHDLDHALPSVSSQTWDGVDCKKTCEYAAPCFPIDVPENDPRIKNRRCIDFIRTSSVCGSGMTSVLFGKLQAREQINQLTSYIDASQVYGFEQIVASDLRDLTTHDGKLRVGPALPGQKSLLPFTGINGMDCRRNVEESSLNCFVAGDIRANEQIGLAAFHTIWMREHNRLASHLKRINPFWNGTRVYNEARKIVGAEVQIITYEHWLPLILGEEGMRILGEYMGYDSTVNPSISNVFATAALRFGHSMINPVLHRLDENFDTIPAGNLLLRDAFFSPWRLVDEGGVDPLIRGMFATPAKLKTPTQNLNSELTEKLFHHAHAVALDLAAINIQRGREHAIPSYTKWRTFCNMSEVKHFHDLKNEISSPTVRSQLKDIYGSVHNIDVWVGGILEDQVEGGKVGPLFRCLLIEQFRRSRDGDRFWYENPTTFTPSQLQDIRRTSLARILCDNSDNMDTISEDVFRLIEEQDGLVSCEDIPSIDLLAWTDCEDCDGEEDSSSTDDYRKGIAFYNYRKPTN